VGFCCIIRVLNGAKIRNLSVFGKCFFKQAPVPGGEVFGPRGNSQMAYRYVFWCAAVEVKSREGVQDEFR